MRHAAGTPAFIALLAAAVLVSAASATASAQTAKPAAPPAPVSTDPSVTTASYGDWTARCEKGSDDKVPRICEAVQTVQPPNQQVPVAQIAIGRAGSVDPLKLVIALPVNVWFPSTVKLMDNDADKTGTDLTWRRCVGGGCVAENASIDESLRRWRGQTGLGRIVYKDGSDRDVVVPISFRGLAQALDALAKM